MAVLANYLKHFNGLPWGFISGSLLGLKDDRSEPLRFLRTLRRSQWGPMLKPMGELNLRGKDGIVSDVPVNDE
eukprot:7987091-Pyramimonas_sp.AAC.1